MPANATSLRATPTEKGLGGERAERYQFEPMSPDHSAAPIDQVPAHAFRLRMK